MSIRITYQCYDDEGEPAGEHILYVDNAQTLTSLLNAGALVLIGQPPLAPGRTHPLYDKPESKQEDFTTMRFREDV